MTGAMSANSTAANPSHATPKTHKQANTACHARGLFTFSEGFIFERHACGDKPRLTGHIRKVLRKERRDELPSIEDAHQHDAVSARHLAGAAGVISVQIGIELAL